jgi:hypothetical protein
MAGASGVLYVVRSRFTVPEREQAWNEWYAEHIKVLLGVPGFIAAQRFRSPGTPDERPYLAMYEVAGPEVFTSDAYLGIWGFDEWRPQIDNWTRDIFDPLDAGGIDFATPASGRLWAGFLSGEEAAVSRAQGALRAGIPSLRVATISGLDQSCGGIAWEVLGDRAQPPRAVQPAGVQLAQAVYTPLIDCLRAAA